MLDPDLKIELDKINQNLADIKNKKGVGMWRSFFSGLLNSLGYVVGLVIILVIFGWFLQKIGLWQSFTQEIQSVQDIINGAKSLMPPQAQAPAKQQAASPSSSGGPTVVTLPNGQQIEVDLPKGY